MDNVLADFDQRIADIWKEKYPDLPFVDLSQKKTFYLEDSMPKEYGPLIEGIFLQKGFFLSLQLIDGAKESLEYLAQKGYTVRICTTPILRNMYCSSEKLEWVKKHLGRGFGRKVIIAKDKTLINGDILIDDKPNVEGAISPAWEHIVFSKPWNQGLNKRYLDWKNYKRVLDIDESCAK